MAGKFAYEFIRFGALAGKSAYEFIRFGAMAGKFAYEYEFGIYGLPVRL